jgi:preprotein translocase subunit SecE
MNLSSPIQFFKQVKQEVKKITWPGKNEVVVTGLIVAVLVLIFAIFFLMVDSFSSFVIRKILSLGSLL